MKGARIDFPGLSNTEQPWVQHVQAFSKHRVVWVNCSFPRHLKIFQTGMDLDILFSSITVNTDSLLSFSELFLSTCKPPAHNVYLVVMLIIFPLNHWEILSFLDGGIGGKLRRCRNCDQNEDNWVINISPVMAGQKTNSWWSCRLWKAGFLPKSLLPAKIPE